MLKSFRALSATLIGILYNRLELISNDLEEDGYRLISLLIVSLVAVFSLMMATIILIGIILFAFWNTHLLLALVMIASFFLVVGIIFVFIARYKAKNKPKIFLASLLELLKDCQQLHAD